MEKEILKEWMERFFLAELTVDEERELYQYLCANEVPAELRKDREVILALCSTAEEDIELPKGAAERLEAMLDGLKEMKTHLNPPCEGGLKKVRPRYTLPHREGWGGSFLLRAASAAGVVAIVFLAIPYGDNNHTDEATVLAMVDEVDKDTFDNPEEAMQCLMAAYGDMMLAVNTARDNTREACLSLEQSQAVLREMFNVNIN
jgi:hypothetical protein